MKIVLVNTSDSGGGAAVACMRLAEALRKNGQEVDVLVLRKSTDKPYVTAITEGMAGRMKSGFAFLAERLQVFLHNGFTRKNLFSVSTAAFGFDILDHPLVQAADIVHLHWINHGFLSLKGLQRLLCSDKKVVWTMHDLWTAAGICHYPHRCERYTEGCGACPFLHSRCRNDLSAKVMKRKRQILPGAAIRFVGCSEWITREARKSPLAEGNHFCSIPNPIDLTTFSPGDRQEARKALGLPADKQLILFGAANAADERKGLRYLAEATGLLADLKGKAELVLCGKFKEGHGIAFGLDVRETGFQSDPAMMRNLYRAADIFVTPSLEDNLPNMIMEAMACGTPCVGFATGGIPEMIRHRQTGWLAAPRSSEELAEGIRRLLENRDEASRQARIFTEENYAPDLIAAKFVALYDTLYI